MPKQKNKQRGITLIALVVTIIVLIILAGVSIAMLVGENGIITQAQRAAQETEQAKKDEEAGLSSLETAIQEALGNVYNEEKGVNAPKLTSGMTPIKFTDPTDSEKGTVVETTSEDTNWYNYEEKKWANVELEDGSMFVWIPRFAYKINKSEKTIDVRFLEGTSDTFYDDEGNKQTALRVSSKNEVADTENNYYVHPAFTNESSINYANGGWDSELTGIWVAKFEAGYASGNNSATPVKSNLTYTQSDAWLGATEAGTSADTSGDARNWLDGIYGETETKISYPVFQPLTYSMNYINLNDAYNISKAMNESGNIYGFTLSSSDTHLIKSSEWGMISYLSYSQYGTKGQDIAINNANLNSGGLKRETSTAGKTGVYSVYGITGMTQGLTDGEETIVKIQEIRSLSGNTPTPQGNMYAWNQKAGMTASSTRNMTGIYDLSGGQWERIASYVANGHENLLKYGESVTYNQGVLKTVSTKYTMVYPHDSTVDNGSKDETQEYLNEVCNANYAKNIKIYGDAIRETSMAGTGISSWQDDYSNFVSLSATLMLRGGGIWYSSHAGRFYFGRTDGCNYFNPGFRPVVVPVS